MGWYDEGAKAWGSGEDINEVARCEICGQPIADYEKYYKMPDGTILCDDYECMCEWAKQYKEGDIE